MFSTLLGALRSTILTLSLVRVAAWPIEHYKQSIATTIHFFQNMSRQAFKQMESSQAQTLVC